jgi:hypothetical protein
MSPRDCPVTHVPRASSVCVQQSFSRNRSPWPVSHGLTHVSLFKIFWEDDAIARSAVQLVISDGSVRRSHHQRKPPVAERLDALLRTTRQCRVAG